MEYENSSSYAQQLDEADDLAHFREAFYIPQLKGKDVIYFCGNSLGLQPKVTQDFVLDELEDWASFGVEGYVHARNPWMKYGDKFPPMLAPLTGAMDQELVVMNQLTLNLHVMMTSFYQPTQTRYKILCEAKAFPSDQYAMQSQIQLHGFNVADAWVQIEPRKGEETIRQEDIEQKIAELGDSLALVLFGGVNYYTGQVFDMAAITKAAHQVGAYCGFDLAHAIGNVSLQLHQWNADFACWCSYKYLNSGPGGVGGAFVHEKHLNKPNTPRLEGWWGNKYETRFQMNDTFDPSENADAWQTSIAPVLSLAVHEAALRLFGRAGFDYILKKNNQLSNYLIFILDDINKQLTDNKKIEIITPRIDNQKGCQISFSLQGVKGKEVFEQLKAQGVVVDWREPNVIRAAPVALYNTFSDVYNFGTILKNILSA